MESDFGGVRRSSAGLPVGESRFSLVSAQQATDGDGDGDAGERGAPGAELLLPCK